jgi:long-chain acyl-CoA synthetase
MYARGEGDRPPPGTLNTLFFEAARKWNKPDAMLVRVDGKWQPISHATIVERVRRMALGLTAIGVARGDRVAILSENRPEWALADYACLTAGFADVPIYATLPAEQIPYLLDDSGAVAIFVSTPAQAAKVASIRKRCPRVRHIIAFDEAARHDVDLTLRDLEAKGASVDTVERAAEYERAAVAVGPNDLATIIYTSGTTGAPKGVMLSHDNIHSNVEGTRRVVPIQNDTALSFLPLSHIFERMGDYWFFATGTTIAYVENFDFVPLAMQEVRPSIALSVPRLYEKMYARVLKTPGRCRQESDLLLGTRLPQTDGLMRSLPGGIRAASWPPGTRSHSASSSRSSSPGLAAGCATSYRAELRSRPRSTSSSSRLD